jgi:bifunctional DNA-binding transcriptional regulator/antitoxin component of YhaV-PrlF toxin-antitoxin module
LQSEALTITLVGMTAKVTEEMQVSLPLDVCAELGIKPGVCLDFRAHEGKLEAVKVSSEGEGILSQDIAARDAEEMAIQKGCSTEVPEDFPR